MLIQMQMQMYDNKSWTTSKPKVVRIVYYCTVSVRVFASNRVDTKGIAIAL